LAKGNSQAPKTERTFVRNAYTGLLEDRTDELRRLAPQRDDVDERLYQALRARKTERPEFSFTGSATALMEAWGPMIRTLGLPITKDGKGAAKESITTVFDRLLADRGIVQTADRGSQPRYEPAV
jgi:hypothetical protein